MTDIERIYYQPTRDAYHGTAKNRYFAAKRSEEATEMLRAQARAAKGERAGLNGEDEAAEKDADRVNAALLEESSTRSTR
jgi:hypothetical protein